MTLTNHGKKRIKQRLAGQEQYFAEALEFGIRPAEVSGEFKRYLDALMTKKRKSAVVYKNFVFLYAKDVLITTFSIPSKYHKITKKISEKKTQPKEEEKEK